MTSRERAEALAADLDHMSRMGGIVDKAYLAKVVAAVIDAAIAEEREACVEALRPDYPDAVRMLVIRRGAK